MYKKIGSHLPRIFVTTQLFTSGQCLAIPFKEKIPHKRVGTGLAPVRPDPANTGAIGSQRTGASPVPTRLSLIECSALYLHAWQLDNTVKIFEGIFIKCSSLFFSAQNNAECGQPGKVLSYAENHTGKAWWFNYHG